MRGQFIDLWRPEGNRLNGTRPVPRLYLVTPEASAGVADLLVEALGAAAIAAVLVRLGRARASRLMHPKALGPRVQESGSAFLIEGHPHLAVRAGADGAHLGGVEALKAALPILRPDRIAGRGGSHRDDAMLAGESGADYAMFGEPGPAGRRPAFEAVAERVAWWAEIFEVPCVGFASALDEVEPLAAAGADFIAVGDWVFSDRHRCGRPTARSHMRLREAPMMVWMRVFVGAYLLLDCSRGGVSPAEPQAPLQSRPAPSAAKPASKAPTCSDRPQAGTGAAAATAAEFGGAGARNLVHSVDLAYGAYQRGFYITAFAIATRRVEEKSDVRR